MKLLDFPIVKITFWLILGIIIAVFTEPPLLATVLFLGIAMGIFGFAFYRSNKNYTQNSNFAIALYFIFFQIGIITTVISKQTYKPNHYTKEESNFHTAKTIQLVVKEKLKSSLKLDRYFAEVVAIDQKESCGKILLNISKNEANNPIIVGNIVLVQEQLTHPYPTHNPNQFDYSQYLENKGVYAQIYTEPKKIAINKNLDRGILYYTAKFRNTIINNLNHVGFKKEELAVINALILGQQQDISSEVIRDYQYAGAIHILSVSGLHVGFILLFITFILRPIPNTKIGNTTKLLIVLISLWLFAFVAGLAPSVIRSTVMFSFVAVGMHLQREKNSFHTVIVSLFLILLFQPLFLLDVGFQLSYLAVIFILWLQPIFQKIVQPKNKIVRYFWDILTVSFAAQIGTLPLSIYYFHQFPGLFFITNIILIPFLSIVMVLGTILMLFAYVGFIPIYLSKTVEYLITIINYIIHKIANVEAFIWRDIPLSTSLMLISYGMLICWIVWIEKPKLQRLVIALTSIILFQITYYYTKWDTAQKEEFIVFHSMKKSILGNRVGNSVTLFSREEIVPNSLEERMVKSYTTANFSNTLKEQPLRNTLFCKNKKILVVDSTGVYQTSITPDIIVLTQSPKVNLNRLLTVQHPEIIIADGSNYKSYVAAWKATCEKRNIPFHSTYEKGYYNLSN